MKKIPMLRFPEFSGEWKIEEFANLVKKPSEKYNPDIEKEVYKSIELESLSQETGILLETFNSKELKSIKNKFRKGDILFGKLRPYLKKFLKAQFEGVCSSEIWVFRGVKLTNDFLYYLIQTDSFNYIANVSSGSKMPRSDWEYVSTSPFLYPDKSEQQKIADFLTQIDRKIEQLSQKKQLLERYKKGVMQQIFSQAIRFKDDDEREFPEWKNKTIGDFVVERIEYPNNEELPLFSLTIENGVTPKTERYERSFLVEDEGNAYKIIKKDDFAYNPMNLRFGAIARYYGENPVALSKYYNIFYCKDSVNTRFCEFYFKSHQMIMFYNKMATGSLIEKKRVHFSEFVKFKILFPCLEEQTKIANFLTALDNKIALAEKQLNGTKQYKKGLLQQLFV